MSMTMEEKFELMFEKMQSIEKKLNVADLEEDLKELTQEEQIELRDLRRIAELGGMEDLPLPTVSTEEIGNQILEMFEDGWSKFRRWLKK